MDKAQEKIYHSIEKTYGKAILSMNLSQFTEIMTTQPIDSCRAIIAALKSEKAFYENVLTEEYRKKNPASLRYREADQFIAGINEKGKALKSIIDSKEKS
ncbi:MAG: hypothetical protein JXB24_09695 [Bacteroidales bacterium]|nr:hypothetical protein [Bacteroidales bacterium]